MGLDEPLESCPPLRGGTARARRAGAPSAEPGAGSAGPGAAQRRRLIQYG